MFGVDTLDKNLTEDMIDGRDLTPEHADLLRRAAEAGFDLEGSKPRITPEQIIQAAIDPPNCSLLFTSKTSKKELSAFTRGKRRGCHH